MNFNSQVGCAGAILTHVRRKRMIRDPHSVDDDTNGSLMYGVRRVKIWTMADTMFLNNDTMTSLQIFADDSRPSLRQQGQQHDRGNGGLSLFGIINLTRTPQGYGCLKGWFLRPSLDPEVISGRHAAIQVFIRPDNSAAVAGITRSLRQVVDVGKTLVSLKKGGASGGRGDAGEVDLLGIGNKGKRRAAGSTKVWNSLRYVGGCPLIIRCEKEADVGFSSRIMPSRSETMLRR